MGTQKKLNIKDLHSGLEYQRKIDKKRIKEIADNFSWNLFTPIVVSFRDNRYNVIDGQHRLFALKENNKDGKNKKEINVPCYVISGLNEKQESELYFKLATGVKQQSTLQILKAEYLSGSKDVIDMVDIINSNKNLTLDFESNSKNGRIVAVRCIKNIYDKSTKSEFKEFIDLLGDTWKGDKKSLQIPVLNAMSLFVKNYNKEYDRSYFIKSLSKVSPEEIIKDGKSDKVSGKAEIGCLKVIVLRYNKGKKKNRLDYKFI